MAGSFSTAYENTILDMLTGKSPNVARYLALSTADPGDDGAGIAEPVGNNYERSTTVGGTDSDYTWNSASAGSTSNYNDIVFNEASGSWGTITHWAIFDSLTNGTMLFHGSFETSKSISLGDTVRISGGGEGGSGGLVITQD